MQEHKEIDYPLFFLVLLLVVFGSIMISSVSVYDSYRITKKLVEVGSIPEPNNWRFLSRNLVQAGIGFCMMFITLKIPYLWWKKQANALYVFVNILLILVLIPALGVEINGTRGWFDVPGIPFSLQPTELLKFALIISVGAYCAKYKNFLANTSEGLIPFLGIIGIPALLVLLQPDLGALFIIIPVVVGMYFVAGGNIKVIIVFAAIGVIATTFLYLLGHYSDPAERGQFSYIYDRINTFFQSNREAIEQNIMHHQNKQALVAIGSGGFFGLGFGNSVQKYGYLPEPQGDFIFSIITEELGFFGAFLLITWYGGIIFRGFIIAVFCEESFGKLIAFGITIWLLWQMVVNMSVNLSILPNTGLTLPFVSYGGSSLLVTLIATGVLLAISREIPSDKKDLRSFFKFIYLRNTRKL